ncbi:hypothetical protein LCM02_06405 [Lutimonas saemankumensis]|uniref:hypothetical protein n=1 Tax=Lutimonas saemankumensis TaxID=483016 RepID=UPI001CD70B6D|nr:hypothetical protein [Lutimonas saemankumensis]MCA0932075.1 hypothetical protein [Lutimonas saemankumensis]
MKTMQFKLFILVFALSIGTFAQQYTKPVQEFKVGSNTTVSVEASYAEIEIIEWNKNKVEIEGLMSVQGLPEEEAKKIFESWDISVQADAEKITIRSNASNFGNEYFFINSDKYLGNVIVDIPEVTARITDIMDSVEFVMPDFESFPEIDMDMIQSFQISGDSIAFNFQDFEYDAEDLKKWQEEHKEEMKKLQEELKKNKVITVEQHRKMHEEQRKIQIEMKEIQKEAMKQAREAQLMAREAHREAEREARRHMTEERARMIEKGAKEREREVQRIIRDRQKVKIKKTLRIKVPKNAKLEMDVDYCKIITQKV